MELMNNEAVIADYRVSDNILARFRGLGFAVIRLPCFRGLDRPVSAHPDLLIFPSKDGLILPRIYYEENRALFDRIGCRLIPTDQAPCREYPADVLFDALAVGDTVYGKEGAVAPRILASYPRFRAVKQGYTRCSVAMIGQRAAVTADSGIARALRQDGIDVLVIRPGHIRLPGYDCGFIGGAGGSLGKGRYAFFGDPLSHPDGEAILRFAAMHGTQILSLCGGALTDYGGFLIVPASGNNNTPT